MPEEEEIDLVELAGHFWNDRMTILKITGVCVLIGLFIALFSAVEYKTDAVLLPEMQSQQSTAENLLNQYGGLLGIGGGAGSQMGLQNVIPPQLYPRIVESVPFQAELMNTVISFPEYDTTATPHRFFQDVYTPSVLSYLAGYTMGLPGKIIELFTSEEGFIEESRNLTIVDRDSVYNLNTAEWETIEQLRERIGVSISDETGIVTLTATMPDAQAAAELGRAGMQILKAYVREYRTQNAQKDLEFVEQQVERAEREFNSTQARLADYRDSNIDLTSARARSQEQELQSEYDLAFNTYNSLRQQLEQAKLKVQEQTPVFSVLQPVTVPLEKSSPNRLLILIVSVMLGIVIGFGWSLFRGWGREMIVEIRDGNNSLKGKRDQHIAGGVQQ